MVDIFVCLKHDHSYTRRSMGARHTIVVGDQVYDFHILPSGLVNPKCLNLVGTGCVVHVPTFFKELEDLQRKGLKTDDRILLSGRAHVVFDLHLLIDGLQEGELTQAVEQELSLRGEDFDVNKKPSGGAIGTTKKGIGPAYSAKHARSGVRIHQIFNKEELDKRLKVLANGARKRYGDAIAGYDVDEEIARFDTYRERLRPFVVDAVPLMASAQEQDIHILVEGANALMLDIVTSSSTGIGGIVTGLAISPFKIKEIIGVVKAYTTRVGSGPFPTELNDTDGDTLQRVGHEYGVTTGRRRRCGWLDLVILKYSVAVNHYTSINLTKLDILDAFATIKVAVAYKDTSSGKILETFPEDLTVLDHCEVVYQEFDGWKADKKVAGIRAYEELPPTARSYVEFIEHEIRVKIKYIGTGAARDDMITR
ncbi:MAG: hypothetical protein Q9223_005329 [Gallowayella weberi]